jgi:ABC-type sugar transport systems, permease components
MRANARPIAKAAHPARELKLKKLRIRWVPILFLLPSIVAYSMFKYYPVLNMMYISLFDYRIADPPGPFVWFRNYTEFLMSRSFWNAIKNTFVFFLLYTLLTFWVPIVQALFLSAIRRGRGFLKFMYQIPTILPAVAGVLVWKWMYNPDRGLLNYWLSKVGLGPYGWLNDLAITKLAIVLPAFFAGSGISVLLYYAAIRSIPAELHEAAKIDGAGPWHRLFSIVLPNIGFLIAIQFVGFMSSILLAFDNIYVMTQGGPADSTMVVSLLVMKSAFQQNRFGVTGAMSFFMLVIIAILTVIQQKLSQERE